MNHAFAALASALGSTLAQWRPILILWLLSLGFAAAITAPWDAGLERQLTHLPQSESLLQSAHVEDFLDLLRVESGALSAARGAAEQLSLIWVVLGAVLFGGLAARLFDRKANPSWLGASGRYGFRSLILLLITVLVLTALVPLNDLTATWVTRWLTGDSHDAGANMLGWTMTARMLVMVLLAGLVTTTGQLARVRMVAREERLAPLLWLRSLLLILRNPLRVGLMTVGLARLLSLWPLALIAWLYDPGALAALAQSDDGWLGALRAPWRVFVVLQLLQLGVISALVYRLAVLVKLWPTIAPELPVVTATVAPEAALASAPAPGDAPSNEAPEQVDDAPEPDTRPENTGGASAAVATALLCFALCAAPLTAQESDDLPAEPAPAATTSAAPVAAAPVASTTTALSEARADYVIHAELDLEARTLSGREQATFLNTTSAPVAELWMHLYAAAFANTDTQWQDNRASATRRTADDAGTIELRSVRLADGTDLRSFSRIDGTLLRVSLPAPVAPGGSVTLDLEFLTRFPRIVARMGMTGAHLDGMQWYPKFAVHDASGWTAQPFYGSGEFFSDFANYEVHFAYPTRFGEQPVELEATGIPGDRVAGEDGKTRVTFRQSDVHDFAFCADPAFQRFEDTHHFAESGRDVQIVYLCQPYALPKAQQVLDAMHSFLRDSGEWWMEYPYDRVVIDGLPHSRGGGMEYPMLFTISQKQPNHLGALVELFEDPVSVTAHEYGHQYWYGILASNEVEEAWLDEGFNTWGTARLEQAHYGPGSSTDLVTLLDRSLTREVLNGAWRGALPFAGRALAAQNVLGWSRSPFHDLEPDAPAEQRKLLGFSVPGMDSWHLLDMQSDRMAWLRPAYIGSAAARPLDTPSRDFTRGYGGIVYRKPAMMLETLRRHIGEAAMERVMRTYVERFRFRHPTKDDFLGVVSELTGGAHDSWMRALVETDDTVDVAVEDVLTRRRLHAGYTLQQAPGDVVDWHEPAATEADEPAPFWERAWNSVLRVPFPGSGAPSASGAPGAGQASGEARGSGEQGVASERSDEAETWLCRWVVRRHGELTIPVEIEATFADGSVQRELWSEPGGYRIFEVESPAALVSVRVDPARKIAVDLNRLNDGYRVRADETTSEVLGEHGRFWAQTWLNGWLLAF